MAVRLRTASAVVQGGESNSIRGDTMMADRNVRAPARRGCRGLRAPQRGQGCRGRHWNAADDRQQPACIAARLTVARAGLRNEGSHCGDVLGGG